MISPSTDFGPFIKEREEAARGFVNGEPEKLAGMCSKETGTFFGPGGGYEKGAQHVLDVYRRDSGRFESGDSDFEIIEMEAGNDMAYWVGFQRAKAKLTGQTAPAQFDLRVTEVFRKEEDEWRLVHRHADPFVEPQAR